MQPQNNFQKFIQVILVVIFILGVVSVFSVFYHVAKINSANRAKHRTERSTILASGKDFLSQNGFKEIYRGPSKDFGDIYVFEINGQRYMRYWASGAYDTIAIPTK